MQDSHDANPSQGLMYSWMGLLLSQQKIPWTALSPSHFHQLGHVLLC